MIDGNRKIFERIWKLVTKVKTFLDENNENNTLENNNSSQSLQKNKSKAAADIYKLRNSQLSMVISSFFPFFFSKLAFLPN